jgi:hypothetical protein
VTRDGDATRPEDEQVAEELEVGGPAEAAGLGDLNAAAGFTPTRRKLLIGAAGAATWGWVAPQMHTLAAAQACGTVPCTPSPVSWLASPYGSGANVTSAPRNVNGTTITATRSNTNNITNGGYTTGLITGGTLGGIAGHVTICRVGNGNPQTASMTFNFNPAITLLSFTLTDIDSSTDSQVRYREEVVISWTTASGTPGVTYSPGTNLINTGTNRYACNSTTFNAANTDPSCNLGVAFDSCGTISSLTILSNDLNTAFGTSNQAGRVVGISSFSFCTP